MNNTQSGVLTETIRTEQRTRSQWQAANPGFFMGLNTKGTTLPFADDYEEQVVQRESRVRLEPPTAEHRALKALDATYQFMGRKPERNDAFRAVGVGGEGRNPAFEQWNDDPHKAAYSRWKSSSAQSNPVYNARYRRYNPERQLWHENATFPVSRVDGPSTALQTQETVRTTAVPSMRFRDVSALERDVRPGGTKEVRRPRTPPEHKVVQSWYSTRTVKPRDKNDKTHLPGYAGHVQTNKDEFGRTFGHITRDVLHFSGGGLQVEDTRDTYLELF